MRRKNYCNVSIPSRNALFFIPLLIIQAKVCIIFKKFGEQTASDIFKIDLFSIFSGE